MKKIARVCGYIGIVIVLTIFGVIALGTLGLLIFGLWDWLYPLIGYWTIAVTIVIIIFIPLSLYGLSLMVKDEK